jgi:glycosyltransferase involved in cell wall biosynthesis
MHRELAARNWDFEVWFMARSEPNRHWTFRESDFDFPHRFLRGLRWNAAGTSWHLNAEVVPAILRTRPEVLLVAGSWTMPTVWLAGISNKARTKIFWSESHLASIQHHGRVSSRLRQFTLGRFNEFAVPGKLAREYVEAYARPARIYKLPNLVDRRLYRDGVAMLRQTARSKTTRDQRTLLLVARLEPEKGIFTFLRGIRLLKKDERSRLRIVIAGDGLQRRVIQEQALDLGITLLGHKDEHELLNLYAAADGFCLPSLFDPNPLVVIEALWAGLPLLLSSRVGNHPECLVSEQNGFLFEPLAPESIAGAVSRWLSLSPEELSEFGKRSLQIAEAELCPEVAIRRFLDQVLPNPMASIAGSTNGKLSRRQAAS